MMTERRCASSGHRRTSPRGKRSEEASAPERGRYRTIFEHTATANIIIDENYIIRLANSKFENS